MDNTQAIVNPQNPAAAADYSGLSPQAVHVKVADPTTLEVVRTFLASHTRLSESGQAPRTFGEAVRIRANLGSLIQRMVDIIVLLTLIVAGCSLAVAIGGAGLVVSSALIAGTLPFLGRITRPQNARFE